jgi:DNA repair protein RAD51
MFTSCVQNVGIPASDIQKLQNAGIYTVDGLARAPRRELEAIKGLSSAKVDKLLKEGMPAMHHDEHRVDLMMCTLMQEAICTVTHSLKTATQSALPFWATHRDPLICHTAWNMVPMGFTTATVIQAMHQEKIKISCGAKDLDDILEGGMETGTITEMYGENRSGKTQLCHTLCVTCQVTSLSLQL